jgi:hypothetical protein
MQEKINSEISVEELELTDTQQECGQKINKRTKRFEGLNDSRNESEKKVAQEKK